MCTLQFSMEVQSVFQGHLAHIFIEFEAVVEAQILELFGRCFSTKS